MTHFNRLLLIFITFVCLSAQNKSLDEIIAVIGDEIITKSDIEQFLLQLKVQNKMNDEQLSSQRPLIMKQMVDEKLLIIKAALDSVEVPEEQLVQESDKRWNDIIQRVQQYGGEKYLEQIYNDKIKNIKKRHRKQIEKELTIYKFRSQYLQNIKISRGEVEEFFKTYKDSLPTQAERVEISNLLLKVHASPERLAESYKKAELVLERLKKGESFKDLAKEFSDDPSKEAGGYLGKVERGTFVKEYEDALWLSYYYAP
jgi:peptidyl-prolyl cis-trans isomerase SurA